MPAEVMPVPVSLPCMIARVMFALLAAKLMPYVEPEGMLRMVEL